MELPLRYDACPCGTSLAHQAMNDIVDIALVGDSAGMVVHGYQSTARVTMDDMITHCAAVARGATKPLLVCDLPFGSYLTIDDALRNSVRLIRDGGASAVKLEGGVSQAPKIAALVAEGIPVMAHVGLLPQTCTSVAGYALAGRTAAAALAVLDDALAVQDAGAFAVVLEKIPFQVRIMVYCVHRRRLQLPFFFPSHTQRCVMSPLPPPRARSLGASLLSCKFPL
jgi:3-methyl-2-oxobutanoate hydroxymethyltransferase